MITADRKFVELIAKAKSLREYYQIKNGLQRASFFEMHTAGFSLIAVDTGIMRTLDQRVGGQVKPDDKSHDDFVEFMAPLKE